MGLIAIMEMGLDPSKCNKEVVVYVIYLQVHLKFVNVHNICFDFILLCFYAESTKTNRNNYHHSPILINLP